ncbi:hypothetical protein, partial [Acidithiobacillus albertensis]|uniref:hypothetical protein n=1 Tax=Acidithiobacillus albertensis TaxID=119978 RepID=UPI000A4CFE64
PVMSAAGMRGGRRKDRVMVGMTEVVEVVEVADDLKVGSILHHLRRQVLVTLGAVKPLEKQRRLDSLRMVAAERLTLLQTGTP